MSIRIVRARAVDELALLHALLLEYERALPPDLRHGPEPDFPSVLRDYGEPHAALVALDDGGPAGCIAMTALDRSTVIMKRLYVRPARRQSGLGRALTVDLIRLARERNYERIVLDTDRGRLQRAFELYRSLGFIVCEPRYDVAYDSPTFMELPLRHPFDR